MTVRPPSAYAPKAMTDPLQAALEHEIMAEKAGTLGRLLKVLEKKLAALSAHEAAVSETATRAVATDPHRETLMDEAGAALWHVVIQRDLCGFTRTDQFLADMKVPAAVRLRMGIVRRR